MSRSRGEYCRCSNLIRHPERGLRFTSVRRCPAPDFSCASHRPCELFESTSATPVFDMDERYGSYEKVSHGDLEEQHAGFDANTLTQRTSRRNFNLVSHLVAVAIGIVLCFVVLEWREIHVPGSYTATRLQRICMAGSTHISYLLLTGFVALVPEELTGFTERVRYNGTLDFPSIYRGNSQEIEEAWNDITNGKVRVVGRGCCKADSCCRWLYPS